MAFGRSGIPGASRLALLNQDSVTMSDYTGRQPFRLDALASAVKQSEVRSVQSRVRATEGIPHQRPH